MAIGGKNSIDEKGKQYWMDKQSEGLPLDYETEMLLRSKRIGLDTLVDLLSTYKFSARQLLMLGNAAGAMGNAWITEMAFTEAIEMEPDNGEAYAGLISYYDAREQWDSCTHVWENGVLKASDKHQLRYHYGRALYRQERYSDALVEAQAALTETQFNHLESVLLALHAYLGRMVHETAEQRQETFAEAKQVWQAALVRFPESAEVQNLSNVLSKDEFEEE